MEQSLITHVHTEQGSIYCYLHSVGGLFEVVITLLRELGLLEMCFHGSPVPILAPVPTLTPR